MSKLYPPLIPGSIPAFPLEDGGTIKIPFKLNPSVGKDEISQFRLKIKDNNSGKVKFVITVNCNDNFFNTQEIEFAIDENLKNNLTIGQFYKVQLACVSNSEDTDQNLYWSTVGIVKAIGKCYLDTLGFEGDSDLGEIACDYWTEDPTEKIYSYQFLIKNSDGTILYEEGEEIIVNNNLMNYRFNENNKQYTSIISYCPKYNFLDNNIGNYDQTIKISAKVKTINGYIVNTDIPQTINISFTNNAGNLIKLNNCGINYDLGLIYLSGNFQKNVNKLQLIRKNLVTSKMELLNILPSFQEGELLNYADIGVFQGNNYQYFLKSQDNAYIVYYLLFSCDNKVDFDGIILSDKEKVLHIKFDSKMSSFKPIIQEQKIETMGSQYPYFSRNGNIYYHEFSINGLISYNMDTENYFIDLNTNQNLHRTETKSLNIEFFGSSTSLTADNIYKERVFKREVLAWLANGEPKLLRSSTEGNFIVRLTGVSLTPNDTLGRMIHSFSATATEVAEYNQENLKKYNLLYEGGNN